MLYFYCTMKWQLLPNYYQVYDSLQSLVSSTVKSSFLYDLPPRELKSAKKSFSTQKSSKVTCNLLFVMVGDVTTNKHNANHHEIREKVGIAIVDTLILIICGKAFFIFLSLLRFVIQLFGNFRLHCKQQTD